MEIDPQEGSSDLFSSIFSITEEQWDEYKIQRKIECGLSLDSDSDAGDDDDGFIDDCNDLTTASHDLNESMEIALVSEEEEEEEDELDDTSTTDDVGIADDGIKWSVDAAVKYVNGEISFEELASYMDSLQESSPTKKEDEVDSSVEKSKEKKRKRRRKLYELPVELRGTMGAANCAFATGNTDKAVELCMEIIQQVPNAQEPYQLLGEIYEEMGEFKKSLQCALVAAYMNPSDTEEWIRLAGVALELSQIQQAIKCYSLAIKNDPANITYHWERCNLCEQVGDHKTALAGYKAILKTLNKPEDGQKCVDVAREMAKVHLHSEKEDINNAIEVLEIAFSKFPSLITSEDVNMLLELQMGQKYYRDALKNFINHCGVVLELEDAVISVEDFSKLKDETFQEIIKCYVPDVLPIDLQVKILVCLIHMKALNAIKELIQLLLDEGPEDIADLYLDVGEALMDIGQYSEAEPVLKVLVASQDSKLPACWLKFADCMRMLNKDEEAISAYETVLILAPCCQEARVSLFKMLLNTGDKLAAVASLKQEYENGDEESELDIKILIERCDLLYELQFYDEFIEAATLAQYSHCFQLVTPEEFRVVVKNMSTRKRLETLRDMESIKNRSKPNMVNCDIPMEKMWDIFEKLCRKLYELERFAELEIVCLEAMGSYMWKKCPEKSKDVDLWGLLACMYNGSHNLAYEMIKEQVVKDINRIKPYNLLCLNTLGNQHFRHNRFCLRLIMKHQDNIPLGLFNGHIAMNCGSYKHALGEYMGILKKLPNDYYINFLVGLIYIHIASQKFTSKRQLFLLQGFAFLNKYIELSNKSQESFYNTGRALHQLGIKDAAIQYYRKALEAPPPNVLESDKNVFDLKQEIAYNMSLIYQASGSSTLSSIYLRKYNIA